jgi:hypothetical protein
MTIMQQDEQPLQISQDFSGEFANEVRSLTTYTRCPSETPTLANPILVDIASHEWFSSEQEELARTAFRGALAAAAKDRHDFLAFTLTAIIDLYHFDRALHAAHLLHKETPILFADIPQAPAGYSASAFLRTITQLAQWEPATPFSILPEVVTVLEKEMPDSMIVVKYTEKSSEAIPDPIIYARYGPWYIKVAQWD